MFVGIVFSSFLTRVNVMFDFIDSLFGEGFTGGNQKHIDTKKKEREYDACDYYELAEDLDEIEYKGDKE